MTAPKPAPDWELAERLYRAGQLTLRQIAEQVGCAHQVLARRAKSKGWQRDLTTRIREAVRAKVSASGAKPAGAKGDKESGPVTHKATDEQIVEGAVAATLLVFASHEDRRGKIKAEIDRQLDQLSKLSGTATLFHAIDGTKKITEMAIRIEQAEREALGMGGNAGMEAWLDSQD